MTSLNQPTSLFPAWQFRVPTLLTAAEYTAACGSDPCVGVSPTPHKTHYLAINGRVYMFALSRGGSSQGVLVYERPWGTASTEWKPHDHYVLPLQDYKEIRLFGSLLVVVGVDHSGGTSKYKVYAAVVHGDDTLGVFTLQPSVSPEQASFMTSGYHREDSYLIRKDFVGLSETSEFHERAPEIFYVDNHLVGPTISVSKIQQPPENAPLSTFDQGLRQDYEELLAQVKAVVSGALSGAPKPEQDKALVELAMVYLRQTLARGHAPQK